MTLQRLAYNSTAKLLLIGVLALLLLIPSLWIGGIVDERQGYRDQAAKEVQAMWGGPQTLGTPILVLPYDYRCTVEVPKRRETAQGFVTENVQEERTCQDYAYLYPDRLDVEGKMPSRKRSKGIFEIPLYSAAVDYRFDFVAPDWERLGVPVQGIRWSESYLALSFSDTRGLRTAPTLKIGDREIALKNDNRAGKPFPSALIAPIPDAAGLVGNPTDVNPRTVSLSVHSQGADRFSIQPVAREAQIRLSSDWQSPAFEGQYLPSERSVGKNGFDAKWQLLSLNHGLPLAWTGSSASTESVDIGFRQVLPVNNYSMTDRAIKYVMLFIALTFILCYFAERLTGSEIHFLQYLLIGISLLLFYTLLLSLSEKIGFAPAYAVATLSISAQIGIFIRKLIGNLKVSIAAVLLLDALYGFLFVLLRLEDHALLAGSVGLFAILGALMYISTRMQLGNRQPPMPTAMPDMPAIP